jgi:hypothetical protein
LVFLIGLGLLGIVLVVFPDITDGRLPGNTGDARFNEYLLEHFYLWATGKVASFWSAGFFFPFPMTIAFSDNHLGNAFIYAAFRALGLDREDAFGGWYLVGFVVNYAACAYALRCLGHGYLATASGAFLFAFGLPVSGQEAHAQLLYRFAVPLAVLGLLTFARRPRLISLFSILTWTVWQFCSSIYIGYFLSLLLAAFVLAMPVLECGWGRAALVFWPRRLAEAWSASGIPGRVATLLGGSIALALLGLLLAPYLRVSAVYGFKRSTEEIESMLPRPASYLFAASSKLWRFRWSRFDAIPMLHEHAMFVGLAPFLGIAVALILRGRKSAPAEDHFRPALAALLIISLLTLFVGHHSLYQLLERLPGVNAIRAVSRIVTVEMFAFAVLLACGIDALMRMPARTKLPQALALLIAAFMVFESSYVWHFVTEKKVWLDRLAKLETRLPPTLPDAPILMNGGAPDVMYYDTEIDAMLLAQQHGWQTYNGYSGSVPPGHLANGNCTDAARNIIAGLQFLNQDTEEAFQVLAARTVRIGYDGCNAESLTLRPKLTMFAGPLPAEAMAATRIEVAGIQLKDGMLHIALLLRTDASGGIPAISTTGSPVRLSARYIGPNETPASIPRIGWNLRQDLTVDIAPGRVQPVDLVMPAPTTPGIPFHVAVSLVQDGVAWFQDRGMPVAVSHQTVTLAGVVRVDE